MLAVPGSSLGLRKPIFGSTATSNPRRTRRADDGYRGCESSRLESRDSRRLVSCPRGRWCWSQHCGRWFFPRVVTGLKLLGLVRGGDALQRMRRAKEGVSSTRRRGIATASAGFNPFSSAPMKSAEIGREPRVNCNDQNPASWDRAGEKLSMSCERYVVLVSWTWGFKMKLSLGYQQYLKFVRYQQISWLYVAGGK